MMIHVDKDAFLPMNLPGSRVFLGDRFTREGPHLCEQGAATNDRRMAANRAQKTRTSRTSRTSSCRNQLNQPPESKPLEMRGPASSVWPRTQDDSPAETTGVLVQGGRETDSGLNLFRILQDLKTALRADDKAGIQDSLDTLDQGIQQVVLTRSQAGARSTTLDNLTQTKEKEKVEDQVMISALRRRGYLFHGQRHQQNQSTLQATLETSGKLIQKSLMDFIK